MDDVLHQPVELTVSELDAVAGGCSRPIVDIDVDIGNHVSQRNASFQSNERGEQQRNSNVQGTLSQ